MRRVELLFHIISYRALKSKNWVMKMNTTTSVEAQGQEISETHELTSKAREFLERADGIVAGAEARRWILDLVEFIEKTSSERDALDASKQEIFKIHCRIFSKD